MKGQSGKRGGLSAKVVDYRLDAYQVDLGRTENGDSRQVSL